MELYWKLSTVDRTAAFLANLRNTFSTLSALPIPTISAVSSIALGGGLELALCTHMRVFASTAQVGLPETKLGIIPGAGGTYRLPGLIGLGRARDLVLTGRRVSAAEAYFLGIADRLVEVIPEEGKEGEDGKKELMKRAGDEVLKGALQLAMEICEGGPVAVRSALKAVGYAREEVENQMYDRVVGTEDRNEALKAFREKRKPEFKGW
jgi:methylglutaconyl-CoA hydratase